MASHNVFCHYGVATGVPSAIWASELCLWSCVDILVITASVCILCYKVTVETSVWVHRQVYCAMQLHMADFLKLERASLAFESSFQLTVQQLVSYFVRVIKRYVLTVFTCVNKKVVMFPCVHLEVSKVSSSIFTYSAAVLVAVLQMLLIALLYSLLFVALWTFGRQKGFLLSIGDIRLFCSPTQQFLLIN